MSQNQKPVATPAENSLLRELAREVEVPKALQKGDIVTEERLRRSMDFLRSNPFTAAVEGHPVSEPPSSL